MTPEPPIPLSEHPDVCKMLLSLIFFPSFKHSFAHNFQFYWYEHVKVEI